MLPAVGGVDTVSVPDVILVHVLPAVIVPALVPAHLTVADQWVACTQDTVSPSNGDTPVQTQYGN